MVDAEPNPRESAHAFTRSGGTHGQGRSPKGIFGLYQAQSCHVVELVQANTKGKRALLFQVEWSGQDGWNLAYSIVGPGRLPEVQTLYQRPETRYNRA